MAHLEFEQNQESDRDMWYDPDTDSIGWGTTYGEHSFNGRPVNAQPIEEYFKDKPIPKRLRKLLKPRTIFTHKAK